MTKTGLLFVLPFVLVSCLPRSKIPQTVNIEGTIYTTGFYGDLFPLHVSRTDDYYETNGNRFRRINHERFTLIEFANDGAQLDLLYCAEPQWDDAYAYYNNDDNFIYYCSIGAEYVDRTPVVFPQNNIDREKYDRLMAFAEEKKYDPFGTGKNAETVRLPLPDRDEAPRLVFYKESADGLFTSSKGNLFHIIDGKLVLVYQYDYRNDKNGELAAVYVPDGIGEYFTGLVLQLGQR